MDATPAFSPAARPLRLERIPDPGPAVFRSRYLRPRRPVVVVGALGAWPAALRSFPALARHCGDQAVEVDWMGRTPFVFERQGRTPTTRMRLADFIEGGQMGRGYVQAREDHLTERLGLRAMRLPFAPRTFLARVDSIWIGGGAGYGLHHDIGTDQFLCQLSGSKRVLLVEDNLLNTGWMQLEPLRSGRFYRSRIRDALPDRGPEPASLGLAQRYVDTLVPGEVLYVPCAWFHEFRPAEPGITVGHRYRLATRSVSGPVASLARHVISSGPVLLAHRADRSSTRPPS